MGVTLITFGVSVILISISVATYYSKGSSIFVYFPEFTLGAFALLVSLFAITTPSRSGVAILAFAILYLIIPAIFSAFITWLVLLYDPKFR